MPERKNVPLLEHCLERAFLLTGDTQPNVWKLAKVTPLASRVASFIVFWAASLDELDRASIGIEDFVERGYGSRRSAYSWQREFQRLWPEYATPNELAVLLLEAMLKAREPRPTPLLRISPPVVA